MERAFSATFAVLSVLLLAASEPRVSVVLEGDRVRTEPTLVRVRVTVPPHAENRALLVEAEGGAYYTRSSEALSGESPRTRWVEWRDVPAGAYTLAATLTDRVGRSHHATTILVVQPRGARSR